MPAFEGGVAQPVTVDTAGGKRQAGAAIPVYIASGGPRIAGPARRVVVVTSGLVEDRAAVPVYEMATGGVLIDGPAVPVFVVQGSLGAAFAPTDISGLIGWWKADTLALSAGNNVTNWPDLSGNGKDLTPPGTAPTYQLASGKPVVRNTASTYLKNTGFAVNARALSVFAVLSPANAASNTKVMAFGPGTALIWNQTSAAVEWGMQTTSLSLYGLPVANGTFYAAGFVADSDGAIAMWRNGKKSYRLQNSGSTAGPSGTLTDLFVGAAAAANNWAGDYKEILVYNSRLSDSQAQQVMAYLAARHGLSLATVGDQVVFDGNSLTNGHSSANPGYTDRVVNARSPLTAYNVGVSGQTIVQMTADAVTQIDPLHSGVYTKNVVVCWEITNYLASIQNPTTVYNAVVSYCQARRAAGWKVVVVTCLPRTSGGLYAGFEADRQTVNTNIRTNWATFADALADVGDDATIGPALASDNTTYYSDKLHLTSAGYLIVANLVGAAIGTL